MEPGALLARLRSGEEQAFEELVRAQGGRLFAAALRILGNDEDARDAVQDGLLAGFRQLDTFDGRAQLTTWLHRIVINHALMRLRKRRPAPEVALDDLLPAFTEYGHHGRQVPEWGTSASIECEETRRLVRESIDRLPEAYRLPLVLRDIEERSVAEVAEVLGVTPNAAKIRVHRARQALRGLLAARLQEVQG